MLSESLSSRTIQAKTLYEDTQDSRLNLKGQYSLDIWETLQNPNEWTYSESGLSRSPGKLLVWQVTARWRMSCSATSSLYRLFQLDLLPSPAAVDQHQQLPAQMLGGQVESEQEEGPWQYLLHTGDGWQEKQLVFWMGDSVFGCRWEEFRCVDSVWELYSTACKTLAR